MTAPARDVVYEEAKKALGDGPVRFAPKDERTISEQIESLAPDQRACFDELKARWAEQKKEHAFSDEMLLRFARCSPGPKKFNADSAFKVMNKFDARYLTLSAESMEKQLQTKTLFASPGLTSVDGHDVFYMKPSRYFPSQTSTRDIIDNLVYCMQTMVEKEKSCEEGIAFLANMDSWSFVNFSVSYCHQFMMTLQGRVPVRVRMFLIVNPPGWFDKIWSIMKHMLTEDFQKKVHMIPEADLGKFLEGGYEMYLPDDMSTGKADSEAMVQDFVAYRKYVEGRKK